MNKHAQLPQLNGGLFLGIGGIETTLVFREGIALPEFAAFDVLKHEAGEAVLRKCYESYASVAQRYGTGLILDSATWRANSDWGHKIGYSSKELAQANHKAIQLLESVRDEYGDGGKPIVISGCIGTRGDGYTPASKMPETEAANYHSEQIETFAETAADMVTGYTLNYAEEAVGMVQAARNIGMPIVISFTVETDGNLASGQRLAEAIEQVDDATSGYTSYFMINCAHPRHFEDTLTDRNEALDRLGGLRVNASSKSHAELNESPELDEGNPSELGRQVASASSRLSNCNVLAGCCGTDHRHIERIAQESASFFQ